MSTQIPDQFTGYAAKDEAAGKKLDVEKWSYTPQKWSEELVDVKISHTGICGSCIHTLTNGWPFPTSYPAICGHEIVGEVVRAGADSGHKVGARVGIGAQAGSCLECENCKAGKEVYCIGKTGMIGTYQGKWKDGSVAQGGYADYTRVQGRFAIAIPKELPSEIAAPMMCAGVTTYSPISRAKVGPGSRVGVVGIGGLGHLGLQWSLAFGADTYAISHSDSKKDDAVKMGIKPDNFIVARDVEATAKKWANHFDLIVVTSVAKDVPIDSLYLKLLRHEGRIVMCALPESRLPAFLPQALVGKGVSLGGSIIGHPSEIEDMLKFAVKHNVKSWVQVDEMSNAAEALKKMDGGKARYRFVLKN